MLTHLDNKDQPRMVDITDKTATQRIASARTIVEFPEGLLPEKGKEEIKSKKGPVFQTAIIAGTQAVKRTAELIPFCHSLPIEGIKITVQLQTANTVHIECTVKTTHKTGVEMEALTGASAAALTIYDMCKSLSHGIVIRDTRLVEKTGGKADFRHEG